MHACAHACIRACTHRQRDIISLGNSRKQYFTHIGKRTETTQKDSAYRARVWTEIEVVRATGREASDCLCAPKSDGMTRMRSEESHGV